ncbi:hypothetical protein EDD18DRAFT_1099224 [Armillaria luteobubalina]|uniref:Uncharacterized protein n=1 Tax=Armillaria luteobubalina TaxID=153913 RepID=A0AA39QL52_9AGAR|nr:hypothetical protein EDD18DRAFT_1099224 [Armillaria luteobubalina]
MSDSRPSTANENLTITGPDSKKTGWFSRSKPSKSFDTDEKDEKSSEVAVVPPEPEVPPVSFTELFRFSTRYELFIDGLALIAAAAAGAAQVGVRCAYRHINSQHDLFGSH